MVSSFLSNAALVVKEKEKHEAVTTRQKLEVGPCT